jgi:hypothetical protein
MAGCGGRPSSLHGLGEFRRHRGLHHKPAGARVGDAERTQRRERERLHDVALAARRVRRQWADQPFDQEAGDAGGGDLGILLRQAAFGDRGRDPLGKFGRQRFAKFEPRRIKLGVDRAANVMIAAERPDSGPGAPAAARRKAPISLWAISESSAATRSVLAGK